VIVVVGERRLRGGSGADTHASGIDRKPVALGWWTAPAVVACLAVAMIGLIVPVASLATWARRGVADGRVSFGDLAAPAISTATIAVVTAVVTVLVVLPIAIATTRRRDRMSTIAAGAVVGGFAIPGLVIALSLAVLALNTPALGWLYQTMMLLVVAYVVHFGSQALASTEQAVRAVPDRIREQSTLLEPNPVRRALGVDLPLMRPGLLAGGGLVMLATVKELPATLLLAPIGFSTLATEIWASYGEGFYAATGLSSLALIAVSAALTWLLVLRRN
jgi:iron(III) transport system permease protein